MDSFQAFNLFKSLKLHFTTEGYDYFKFKGKVRGDNIYNQQKFLAQKSSYFFTQLSRHSNPESLIVSNFLVDSRKFITDIISEEGLNNYKTREIRLNKLYYQLKQDLQKINLNEMKSTNSNGLPLLFDLYLQNKITVESLCLIDECIKQFEIWFKDSHPLLQNHMLKLIKYKAFINVDKNKLKHTFEIVYKR